MEMASFVSWAFLTKVWGEQQGGIYLPIEGGVVLCLLGVIMDHTWSCSSGPVRLGPPCVDTGTALPPLPPRPIENPSQLFV